MQRVFISDLLQHGAENGKHRAELMAFTGLRDRELRQQIQAERLQGTPILSSAVSGYYLPRNSLEVAECAIPAVYEPRNSLDSCRNRAGSRRLLWCQ